MRIRNSLRSKVAWSGVSVAAGDEDLAVRGLGRLDGLAEPARIDRHVAPAEHDLAMFGDDALEDALDGLAGLRRRAA